MPDSMSITFGQRLSFFFNAHNNFLEEIAKFRAARRLWARLMRDRFGATNTRAQQLRFHTACGPSGWAATSSTATSVDAMVATARAEFGRLDGLVNLAYAHDGPSPLAELSAESLTASCTSTWSAASSRCRRCTGSCAPAAGAS